MNRLNHSLASSILAIATMALLVGCSSTSSGNPATSDASGPADAASENVIGCQTGKYTPDNYAANMQKPGVMGKYTFTLVQAAPAPPGLHENAWTLKVADASGMAPPMAELSALPFMPVMGHGTTDTPQFMANPDGTIAVSHLLLFMPGFWTITISITAPPADPEAGAGTLVDQVVFGFCVDG